MKNNITPIFATHPGELIKDELRERRMTQKELSQTTGIKESVLSETINGKRAISLNMSLALEKALDIPAEYWMNLQTQYDIDYKTQKNHIEENETIEISIPKKDINLLMELSKKFGWTCLF